MVYDESTNPSSGWRKPEFECSDCERNHAPHEPCPKRVALAFMKWVSGAVSLVEAPAGLSEPDRREAAKLLIMPGFDLIGLLEEHLAEVFGREVSDGG